MDSLEFLMIVAVFAVVLGWYLKNAEAGSEGLIGLLAMGDDPDAAKGVRRRSYRIKDRTARKSGEHFKNSMRDSRTVSTATPTYSARDESAHMRRRFRQQDDARYKVKDKRGRGAAI